MAAPVFKHTYTGTSSDVDDYEGNPVTVPADTPKLQGARWTGISWVCTDLSGNPLPDVKLLIEEGDTMSFSIPSNNVTVFNKGTADEFEIINWDGTLPIGLYSGFVVNGVYSVMAGGFLFDAAQSVKENISDVVTDDYGELVGEIVSLDGDSISATAANTGEQPVYSRVPVGGRKNLVPTSIATVSSGYILTGSPTLTNINGDFYRGYPGLRISIPPAGPAWGGVDVIFNRAVQVGSIIGIELLLLKEISGLNTIRVVMRFNTLVITTTCNLDFSNESASLEGEVAVINSTTSLQHLGDGIYRFKWVSEATAADNDARLRIQPFAVGGSTAILSAHCQIGAGSDIDFQEVFSENDVISYESLNGDTLKFDGVDDRLTFTPDTSIADADIILATPYGTQISRGSVTSGVALDIPPIRDVNAYAAVHHMDSAQRAAMLADYQARGAGEEVYAVGTSSAVDFDYTVTSSGVIPTLLFIGANGAEYESAATSGVEETVTFATQGLTAPVTIVIPNEVGDVTALALDATATFMGEVEIP